MTDPKNEVLFCEYCKTCKHKLCDCDDEPCCDCLAAPVNYYSHKPVLWEGVDTLFNKPVERRNYEAERAVREAIYLNAKDIAEAIDKQGTIASKVHMRDLISCAVSCIGKSCMPPPIYTYGEMENLLTMIVSGVFKSDAKVITRDMLKGYTGYTSVDIPNAEKIGDGAFINNARLTFDHLETVKKIGDCAFSDRTSLNNYSWAFLNVEYIGYEAFAGSSVSTPTNRDGQTTLDLDKLEYLGPGAFADCNRLRQVRAGKLGIIPANAFMGCGYLQGAWFNAATFINSRAFASCVSLRDVSFNSVEHIGDNAFRGCTSLQTIDFADVDVISSYAFQGCYSLTEVSISKAHTIQSFAFDGCYNLTFIDLSGVSSVTELQSWALPDPSDLSSDLKIIVPGELYYAFRGSYNWRKYRQFLVPVEDSPMVHLSCTRGGTIKNSFGTAYPDQPVDTVWYVPPSTPINIEHTISPDSGYDILSVYDNDVECTNALASSEYNIMMYAVDSIDGASYGFALDSSGWYVSQNKGVDDSVAICRVNLNLLEATSISFTVINYAESNCDYGVVGKVDTSLSPTSVTDNKANYYWSGASNNSSATRSFSISVPAGEHFIDIKFRKDRSLSEFNDAFKFKITNTNKIVDTKRKYIYNLENLNEYHDIYVQFVKKSSEETEVPV